MDNFQDIFTFSKGILSNNIKSLDCLKGNCEKGLRAYQNNYLFSLIDAMKSKYGAVLNALGENNFKYFARSFILEHPSRSPNIDDYGLGFDLFLANRSELKQLEYLKYIAQLDLFWFNMTENLNAQLKLPKGVLTLWESLQNDTKSTGSIIDENKLETIKIMIQNDEFYLVASSNE